MTITRKGWTVLLILLALLLLGACRKAPQAGNPALPPGFADTHLPDAPIAVYAYFAQEAPLRILPRSLAPTLGDAPDEIGVVSSALWVAPDGDTAGGVAVLKDTQQAELLELLLQESQLPLWIYRSGQVVAAVSEQGRHTSAFQEAIRQNRGVRLAERYPQAWALLQKLPPKPPGSPVGAGFVFTSKEFIDALARRTGGEGQGIQQAIGTARVEAVAFALYTSRPLALDSPLDNDPQALLEHYGVTVLGVARAGLPSLIVRLGFSVVARQAGLEPIQLQGHTVYGIQQDTMHLRLRVQGNLIYIALAPSPDLAEAGIASTIPKE